LDDILSYIEAFSFVTIVRWQKTSILANQRSPTLTTPKCKYIIQNIIKVSFLHSWQEGLRCHPSTGHVCLHSS